MAGSANKPTVTQMAVAIFLEGTLDEATKILEIGSAIVDHRMKAKVPAEPPAGQPVRRNRPGRPRVVPPAAAVTGPVLVPAPETTAPPALVVPSVTAGVLPRRRRGRPPVSAAAAAAAEPAASAAPEAVEAPTQEVDPDFVPEV